MQNLLLLWAAIGLVCGLIAYAARVCPLSWQSSGWWLLPVMGALAALGGGWLGVLALGSLFATGVALWVSLLAVVGIPLCARRLALR